MKVRGRRVLLSVLAPLALLITGAAVWKIHRLRIQETARHHNNLGVALMDPGPRNDGEYQKAVAEFENALRLWPGYPTARVNLGVALFHSQNTDRAIRTLEETLREEGASRWAHFTLGLIEEGRKRYREAANHFALVLEQDPGDPHALYHLGVCQQEAGAPEEAIVTLRRLLDRWPRSRSGLYRLSRAFFNAGRKEEAKEYVHRFQQTDPQSGSLPLGPIGARYAPIERYALPVPDSRYARPRPEIQAIEVDVARELGIDFRHAGSSPDPKVRRVLEGQPVETGWFDSAANRTRLIAAVGAGCAFSDFDNDGRLDLFLVNVDGRHALYSQDAAGSFQDATRRSGIGPEPLLGMACASADYDNDGWSDLFIAGHGGGRLYRNRGGAFDDVTGKSGIGSAFKSETWCTGAVFADVDHDEDLDLYVTCLVDLSRIPAKPLLRFPDDFEGQPNLFFRNDRNGSFTEIAAQGAPVADTRPGKCRGAWFRDVDEDRVMDLVLHDLSGSQTVLLNRLDGTFLPPEGPQPASARAVLCESAAFGDYDRDGAVDRLVNRNGALAALLRNRRVPRNWLTVLPKRSSVERGNRQGIGARVEVRYPESWWFRDLTAGNSSLGCDAPEVYFDLNETDRLDYVRVTFPSGARTAVRDVRSNQVLTVEEPNLEGNSCPFLFAWNGERFEFIGDTLSAGILGEPDLAGGYWRPDPDEWVRIPGERLREKDSRLELRFVNALEEVTYLDQVRLIAADHPAGQEVYPNERMVLLPSSRPSARIYLLEDLRPPAGAFDHLGRDATGALRSADRKCFDSLRLLPFKGFAEDWSLTLDLGEHPAEVLLLQGWTAWNSTASARAASQAGKSLRGPSLEVQDSAGRWRRVTDDLGMPAGLPRTILFDLRGVLREGERVIRIASNRTIYLDQALVADVVQVAAPDGVQSEGAQSAASPRRTELTLEKGDLRWLGYPRRFLPEGTLPVSADYHQVDPEADWFTPDGHFTRYGEVTPLLGSADDRFAILRHGDEVALSFDASRLPELPPGWKRTWLLYLNGYEKSMDLHCAHPATVEPLPFHAMPSYPYPGGAYPADDFHLEYVFSWNTRGDPPVFPPR